MFSFRMIGSDGQTSQIGVLHVEVINNNDPTEIYFAGPHLIEVSCRILSSSCNNFSRLSIAL